MTATKRKPRKRLRSYFPSRPLIDLFDEDTPAETIAQALGVTRASIYHFKKTTHRINWATADKIAIRLGLHPMSIWGYDWIEEQPRSTTPDEHPTGTMTDPH